MLEQSVLLHMLGILCSILFVLFLIIVILHKKLNEKNKDQIFITKKNTRTRIIHTLYVFLNHNWMTSYFVGRVRKRFEILEPGNIKKIEFDTMKTILWVGLTDSIILILGLCIDISMYMIFCTCSFVYIVTSYLIYRIVDRKEILLMKQLREILVELRHHYYEEGNVEAAIDKTVLDAKMPIDIHLQKIYDVLLSDDLEEDIQRYNIMTPNRFLKMLLSLCVQIKKYGDEKVDGQSLFLRNLTYLKEELDIEIRKRELINHKLTGLVWIATIPMFLLKLIEIWAISNLPELKLYYRGQYGMIVSIIIGLTSLLIYSLLNRIREVDFSEQKNHFLLEYLFNISYIKKLVLFLENRNYGKTLKYKKMLRRIGESITIEQLNTKRIFISIFAFLVSIMICFEIHNTSRTFFLTNTLTLDSMLLEIPNGTMKEDVKHLVVTLSKQYKDNLMDEKVIKSKIEEKVKNPVVQDEILKEIRKRTDSYKKNHFQWYDLFLSFIVAFIGFEMPVILIAYENRMLKMAMQNEVIQFQSIILMLMYMKRISTKEVLEVMEEFALIFKNSISECLDEFSLGELRALQHLKEKEEYQPFQKIIDNLIAADKTGIEKACEEIESDRKSSQEQRKQDNQIYIDDKSAEGSFLSFIPMTLVIVLYIIVPFVAESLSQLSAYVNQMGQLTI